MAALLPGSSSDGPGLDNAIRLELLITALQDKDQPHTLCELLRVLERISAGEVAEDLLGVLRKRSEQEPHRLLKDLAA